MTTAAHGNVVKFGRWVIGFATVRHRPIEKNELIYTLVKALNVQIVQSETTRVNWLRRPRVSAS